MNKISFESLKQDLTFTGDLLIGNNFVLLPHTAPVSENLLKAIKDWNFDEFICDGDYSLGGDIGVSFSEDEEETTEPKAEPVNNKALKKVLENSKISKYGNSDKSRMEMVHRVYNEYMNYINSLFTRYVTHKTINQEELSETVKELIIFIKDNRRYILRVTPSVESRNKNFLVAHSMRTTVLAITIGLQLRKPLSQLIELGVSCILHEIGMVRLPPQLYMTDRKFSASEKQQVMTHPILGYNIVKELNFPISIQLGILEHHEKENGTGYPRQLTGDKITSYAKIISLACTFEAITAPRGYKDERTTFDAMVEMLKNQNHQYDDEAIKALLYSVSLFPIGAYVYLKNGKIGMVTDVNPDNPKLPVVQLITERREDGSPKTIQTNEAELAITRVLSKKETEDVQKAMEAIEKKNKPQEQKPAPAVTHEIVHNAPVVHKNADGTEEVDIGMFS